MATLDDVRTIALGFPDVFERVDGHRGGMTWRTPTGGGAFVWERGPSGRDVEQLAALGREWPAGEVVALRVDDEQVKAAFLNTYPGIMFTIPHFDGFAAVLVRLGAIDLDHLREVITDAWLLKASRRTAQAWLAEHPPAG